MSITKPDVSSSAAPRLKLVIRRLPPTLPEEVFWKSVDPWVTERTCQWKRYIKGRTANGADARARYSRAYCLMADLDSLVAFHNAFDGHIFRSKTGAEFQAVVEVSPMQKTPYKAKIKVDARQGTIDDDPDYQSFLVSLSEPLLKPVLETSVPAPPPTSTPLLDHLRQHRGKSGRNAAESSTTSGDRRAAAIASVSKSAAKRAGTTPARGPVMVAGKGREVVVVPAQAPSQAGSEGVPATGEGKKGKKRGKSQRAITISGGTSLGKPSNAPTAPAISQQGDNPAAVANGQNHASTGTSVAASGSLKSREPGQGAANPSSSADSGRGRGKGQRGRGDGGKGSGRGGSGRGGARGGASDRSAHGAVIQILSRNAEAGSGEGGAATRGRGPGAVRGKAPDPAASAARIDM